MQGDTLLGQVCHIRGAKPGSPRHDYTQSDADRHSYSNLILLCPNHHSVIDDDEETYSVDRVERMKAIHETHATQVGNTATENAAMIIVGSLISSTGQSGGITASAVSIGTLNMSNAATTAITSERELLAVEKLWNIIQALKNHHGDLWLAETLLTTEELEQCFQTCHWPGSMKSIMHYSSEDWSSQQLTESGANDCDSCRLYVSDRLWAIFFTIRALYGRLGILYTMGFRDGAYKDWRKDAVFAAHANALLGESLFEQARNADSYGLETALGRAEAEFLREARAMHAARN